MSYCYFCGKETGLDKIYKTSLCPSCGKELKICLNCRFYDNSASYQCRESINEPVIDKDKSNFCDFYAPATDPPADSKSKNEKKNSAKDQFNALFGDND